MFIILKSKYDALLTPTILLFCRIFFQISSAFLSSFFWASFNVDSSFEGAIHSIRQIIVCISSPIRCFSTSFWFLHRISSIVIKSYALLPIYLVCSLWCLYFRNRLWDVIILNTFFKVIFVLVTIIIFQFFKPLIFFILYFIIFVFSKLLKFNNGLVKKLDIIFISLCLGCFGKSDWILGPIRCNKIDITIICHFWFSYILFDLHQRPFLFFWFILIFKIKEPSFFIIFFLNSWRICCLLNQFFNLLRPNEQIWLSIISFWHTCCSSYIEI